MISKAQERAIKWVGLIKDCIGLVGAIKEEIDILEQAEQILNKYVPAIHELHISLYKTETMD